MTTGRPRLARSILDVIGNTPLVELSHSVASRGLTGRLLAKLEYFSPGGSKKDRIALEIINEARAIWRVAPGANGRRADQRKHGDRFGGGLSGDGASVRRLDIARQFRRARVARWRRSGPR